MLNLLNNREGLSLSRLPARCGWIGGAASLLVMLSGCHRPPTSPVAAVPRPKALAQAQPAKPAGPPPLPSLPPGGVRAIYLTGWTAGVKKLREELVALVDRTEINAMVIDVKDDGLVSYGVDVPLVREVGANRRMMKVDAVMETLRAHHIFPIARIACFRDTILAEKHPELAVQTAQGKVWHDKTHHAWLNPYQKRTWDYNVDIALDAIKHGFQEIQFDYVRFPSEGKLSELRYPGKPADGHREDQIAAFMQYAHEKFREKGVWFSADVFGLTSLVKDDEGIGQKFNKVVQQVDYLCPMIYPSHYHHGEYRIPDPNREPYKIVHLSLGDAQKRLKSVATCKLRPWLQDFSLHGVHYGPTEVRAQIKAAHDLGIEEFILWNADCHYTEAALQKEKPQTVSKASPPSAKP